MRSLVLASTLVMAAALAGCSSPSEKSYSANISLSSTSSSFAHLEAGGLAIRAKGDTAVNFDLIPAVSVKNDSNEALHLFAVWELYPLDLNLLHIISRDTIDIGLVAPGAMVPLDSIPIVTFSDSDLYGKKLGISLDVGILNTGQLESVAETDSVPFSQRYHGFIYTTESSPNPIGIFDAPDDGDWIGDSNLTLSPAYPNPTNGITEGSFTIPGSFTNPETLDSVRGDIHITPHHIVRSLSVIQPKSGVHATQFDLSGLSSGLYRLVWTAYKNGVVFTGHGDIMVPLQ